jgi:hypothetical protein
MDVISAVTLLFLPHTFVATLSSASLWNFSPGNSGAKVSLWVWLYWIVTGALTAAVLCLWRGITRVNQERLSRRPITADSEQFDLDYRGTGATCRPSYYTAYIVG